MGLVGGQIGAGVIIFLLAALAVYQKCHHRIQYSIQEDFDHTVERRSDENPIRPSNNIEMQSIENPSYRGDDASPAAAASEYSDVAITPPATPAMGDATAPFLAAAPRKKILPANDFY